MDKWGQTNDGLRLEKVISFSLHTINGSEIFHCFWQVLENKVTEEIWILLSKLGTLVAMAATNIDEEGFLRSLWGG